jgi:hypothetical protein
VFADLAARPLAWCCWLQAGCCALQSCCICVHRSQVGGDTSDQTLGVFAAQACHYEQQRATTPGTCARQMRTLMAPLLNPERVPTPPVIIGARRRCAAESAAHAPPGAAAAGPPPKGSNTTTAPSSSCARGRAASAASKAVPGGSDASGTLLSREDLLDVFASAGQVVTAARSTTAAPRLVRCPNTLAPVVLRAAALARFCSLCARCLHSRTAMLMLFR